MCMGMGMGMGVCVSACSIIVITRMSRSKADAGASRGRPPRNPGAGLALRGGRARGDAADDSDDDGPADVSLAWAARSQLQ